MTPHPKQVRQIRNPRRSWLTTLFCAAGIVVFVSAAVAGWHYSNIDYCRHLDKHYDCTEGEHQYNYWCLAFQGMDCDGPGGNDNAYWCLGTYYSLSCDTNGDGLADLYAQCWDVDCGDYGCCEL